MNLYDLFLKMINVILFALVNVIRNN